MEASKTLVLESCGGTQPTPYPEGGVHVTRGQVQIPETGVYEFRPGYGASAENLDYLTGRESVLSAYPTPAELWQRFRAGRGIT